jgi:hypothetical protein
MTTQSALNIARIRKARAFLVSREESAIPFTRIELVAATGWKPGTINTYLSKKWAKLIGRDGSSLRAIGARTYRVEEFIRLMSHRDVRAR